MDGKLVLSPDNGNNGRSDGNWLYVGNYADSNISVLRVDGDTVVNTGVVVALPGPPASMRGRLQ